MSEPQYRPEESFPCPYCGADCASDARKCPDCGAPVVAPARATPSETKGCPMCGESILAVAQKCRYCGETVEADRPAPRSEAAPVAVAQASGEELGLLRSPVPPLFAGKGLLLIGAAFLLLTAIGRDTTEEHRLALAAALLLFVCAPAVALPVRSLAASRGKIWKFWPLYAASVGLLVLTIFSLRVINLGHL